jgi:hypothetical protein
VPRHTSAPQKVVWGAAKFGITSFFIDVLQHKVPPNCHLSQLRVPPNIFKGLKGAANQKWLKNTAIDARQSKTTTFEHYVY